MICIWCDTYLQQTNLLCGVVLSVCNKSHLCFRCYFFNNNNALCPETVYYYVSYHPLKQMDLQKVHKYNFSFKDSLKHDEVEILMHLILFIFVF